MVNESNLIVGMVEELDPHILNNENN